MATPLYFPARQWIKDEEFKDADRYYLRLGGASVSWLDIVLTLFKDKESKYYTFICYELLRHDRILKTDSLEEAKALSIEIAKKRLLHLKEVFAGSLEGIEVMEKEKYNQQGEYK